jgi:tRNA(fMet)-specific endonuclease VapC
MRYLIDSDWIVDYLKGRAPAQQLLESLLPDGIAISIITYAEIYEGVYHGTDRKRHEDGFHALLRLLSVLSLTRPVARRYARLRGRLQREGQLIDQPDLFIAATALEHDLILVARNTRDFGRIAELQRFHRRGSVAAKVEGTAPIPIRVPVTLLAGIKAAAATRGIPYQRLMKIWLEEGLAHDNPNAVLKPVTLHLTEDQLNRLRQSGSLDIHLEAS